MSSLFRNLLILIFVVALVFTTANPVTGQRHHRGPHFRNHVVVGSFAPVAPVFRPGGFTPFLSTGFYVQPSVFSLPYFPRYATPGFFQSYYRPSYENAYRSHFVASIASVERLREPVVEPGPVSLITSNAYRAPRISALDTFGATTKTSSALVSKTASGNLVSTKYDAADYQRLAEQEFRAGDFEAALKHIHHAVIEDNQNGKLLLFASHASLALGDYSSAVNQLERATEFLDQNDWNFVIRNRFEAYDRVSYQAGTDQLRSFMHQNPNSVNALVLSGFHLGCVGALEQAQIDLATALSLQPDHTLARRLLNALKLPTVDFDVSMPHIYLRSPLPKEVDDLEGFDGADKLEFESYADPILVDQVPIQPETIEPETVEGVEILPIPMMIEEGPQSVLEPIERP